VDRSQEPLPDLRVVVTEHDRHHTGVLDDPACFAKRRCDASVVVLRRPMVSAARMGHLDDGFVELLLSPCGVRRDPELRM